ncbi:hypothetical protein [Arthrobacter oryzae]|uniref:hypothetical protein n=1 Tax=Arthrobacter oryzae TaxID=409290 RepID=UPI0030C978CC
MSTTSNHRSYAHPEPSGRPDADVLEIYPGARDAAPVAAPARRRLMGSEVGMATAE